MSSSSEAKGGTSSLIQGGSHGGVLEEKQSSLPPNLPSPGDHASPNPFTPSSHHGLSNASSARRREETDASEASHVRMRVEEAVHKLYTRRKDEALHAIESLRKMRKQRQKEVWNVEQ